LRSFYHFLLTYRGEIQTDESSQLADWAFYDHNFPKQSTDYDEISNYLEMNSPFPSALAVFDDIWNTYAEKYLN